MSRSAPKIWLENLEIETTRWRQPPWLLEVTLIWPRPGIDERVQFREVTDTPPVQFEPPSDLLFRENVERTCRIRAVIRRKKSGVLESIRSVVTNALGRFLRHNSQLLAWYDYKDLLEAGQKITGIREQIRAEHPPDATGHAEISPDYEGTLKIELNAYEDWRSGAPEPRNPNLQEIEKIAVEQGEKAGALTLRLEPEG